MTHVLVLITLSDEGIGHIRSIPDLPKREMEFVNRWKDEGFLESFFISTSKKDAVLIFKNSGEQEVDALIKTLPYYPFMQKIESHILDKQF